MQNKNIKISIVIPIYNSEKYLKQMLTSLSNQTMIDVEIICVNDGSADNSLEIINNFVLRDKRFKVFSQLNKGVSSARNLGLKMAQGKYIWFVDSDDWVLCNSLEKLYEIAEYNKTDMVFFSTESFNELENKLEDNAWYGNFGYNVPNSLYDKTLCFEDYKSFAFKLSGSIWNKFILRDYIVKNGIYFNENNYFMEDRLFYFDLLLKKPNIYFSLKKFYFYRVNRFDNITGKINKINIIKLNLFSCYNIMLEQSQKSDDDVARVEILNNLLLNLKWYFEQCNNKYKFLYYKKASNLLKSIQKQYNYEYLYDISSFRKCKDFFKDGFFIKIIENDSYLICLNCLNINLFRIKNTPFIWLLRILEIPIFTLRNKNNTTSVNLFGVNIFKSIMRDGKFHKFLFGIKYKIEENIESKIDSLLLKLEQNIKRHTENLMLCINLHQKVFPKYKNIHLHDEIVLVGSGPTLNYYKFNNKKIHIGCNRVFRTMELDYLFIADGVGTHSYLHELSSYKTKCKIFMGKHLVNMDYSNSKFWFNRLYINDDFALKCNAERYYINAASNFSRFLYTDIDLFPLAEFRSVIHAAFQFALFTGTKKIYIVGCDSQFNGYYDGDSQDLEWAGDSYDHVVNGWKKIKNFTNVYYPNVEIISINPVALKGIFKDVYTKKYIADHPELLRENIEIIQDYLL
ncbi:TPA: glycosyltransferase family 2 protein [Campylobacter jejuni]